MAAVGYHMVTLFFRPWWPSYGPNRDKTRNGTVLGQGASIGEDSKSLRLVVTEFQRGCKSWLQNPHIYISTYHIESLRRHSKGAVK